MLDPVVAGRIFYLWHCMYCKGDLFSAAWNAQLDSFISWRPQPGAMAVNGFSVRWKDLQGYLFPPFSFILRCLSKIRQEQANVVMV